eukprot:m51a1_g2854 putative serine threonine-protein kinase ctr1 (2517) ;mRNA; f:310360-327386
MWAVFVSLSMSIQAVSAFEVAIIINIIQWEDESPMSNDDFGLLSSGLSDGLWDNISFNTPVLEPSIIKLKNYIMTRMAQQAKKTNKGKPASNDETSGDESDADGKSDGDGNSDGDAEDYHLYNAGPVVCLKYIVVVNLYTGLIIYCSDGFPGASADVTILRQCGLLQHLSEGELLLADLGHAMAFNIVCRLVNIDLFREPAVTSASPEVLVGLTSPSTSISATSSRAGLVAALNDANLVSRLQFTPVWLDNGGSSTQSAEDAIEMVCNRSVFLVAATVGSTDTVAVLRVLRELAGSTRAPVPLVGPLTSSPDLHDVKQISGAEDRIGVVNVRAEAVDEMSAIVSFLSRDVVVMRRTAIVSLESPYGSLSTRHIQEALESMEMKPWAVVNLSASAASRSDAKAVVDKLLRVGATGAPSTLPRAVVVASTGRMTAPIIEEVVSRGLGNMTFVCGSNPGPSDVFSNLTQATRALLKKLNSQIYFQQHVPHPNASSTLISEFWASINRSHFSAVDHDTLEGYIVGRLITMAASRSLEIYGWPLTRQTFLDTVYRSYRTFDLRGTEFGPYGDGVAPQTTDDLCSHGIHEVFMDKLDLATGELVEEASTSFKFAGCNVPSWTASRRAVMGFFLNDNSALSAQDDKIRQGLSAAFSASNSYGTAGGRAAFAANFRGSNATRAIATARKYVLAVAGLNSAYAREVAAGGTLLIAPLSGSSALRFPFNRNIINVVPLMQQEMSVALQYIARTSTTIPSIAVVCEDTEVGREYSGAVRQALKKLLENSRVGALLPREVANVTLSTNDPEPSVAGALDSEVILFAGGSSAAATYLKALYQHSSTWNKTKVLCSEVLPDMLQQALTAIAAPLDVLRGVHLLSGTPPLAILPSSNAVRQKYEGWVSEVDRSESSFRGFVVGLFLSAIISAVDSSDAQSGSSEAITSQMIVDTIYRRSVFSVEGLSVGPFEDECKKGTGIRCCNQGLDKVYISKWQSMSFAGIQFDETTSMCGKEFDPTDYSITHSEIRSLFGLTVGLSVGLGVAVFSTAVLLVSMFLYSRRTLSFLDIKRTDLEINECIGRGRHGQLHVGDWHGTTIVIRVINKKEVSKGDLATIKEEIGLLHKLHHPNLLMLMGYCETQKELYVVSEYMSGGSLKEYLARNRGQLGVFSLIAIAFDVVKGIAYLHASKPPIVHGSISTRSLLVDDKLTTKTSLHPEPDISTPKEVVELLYQCWEPQPDQRPTIFTVLRSWPSTFATIGRFELPSDLSHMHTTTDDSRTHMPACPVSLAFSVLWGLVAAVSCDFSESAVTSASPEVLVGLTSPSTSISATSSRAGLVAALNDANLVSRLQFTPVWLDNGGSSTQSAEDAIEMVCNRSVFLVAATVGSTSTVAVLNVLRELAGSTRTPVPLVGPLTSAPELHEVDQISGADDRIGVVNVRSQAVDEMSAIVSFLSRDLDVLTRIAIVSPDSTYGVLSTQLIQDALESLDLEPLAVVNVSANATSKTDATTVVDSILKSSTSGGTTNLPRAVIVVATRDLTVLVIEEVVSRGWTNVTFVCGANPGPTAIYEALSASTLSLLDKQNSDIYFQQQVPHPNSSSTLISEFWTSINKTNFTSVDHDTLEGYIVGRLITMAASRSLEIYGWPLTRARFLDTVYRSYRTFSLRGTEFGPYGDGIAPQTTDDLCTNGIHEVFMDKLDLSTGELVEEASTSFKFAGCNVPNWSSSRRAVMGFFLSKSSEYSVQDGMIRLGLSAALSASNSDSTSSDHVLMAATVRGYNVTKAMVEVTTTDTFILAVAGLDGAFTSDAVSVVPGSKTSGAIPLIAPLSGSSSLRFPFSRNIINLVPLMQQEMSVALQYIASTATTTPSIAVVYEDTEVGREYSEALQEALNLLNKNSSLSQNLPSAVSNVTLSSAAPDSTAAAVLGADVYVFAGRSAAAAQFLQALYQNSSTWNKTKVLCSEVLPDILQDAIEDINALRGVHLLSGTPPLAMLSSTNSLRETYEEWVSEVDRSESSFRGFFVGMFLNAIVEAVDNTYSGDFNITSQMIVDTVYKRGTFTVGSFTVGTFVGECKKGTGVRCCNQGLDDVYITAWKSSAFSYVSFDATTSACGKDFDPTDYSVVNSSSSTSTLGLTVGLATGLGVAAVLVVGMMVSMFFYSRRTLSFLNIKRPDLEINECIGKGRFGQMHVGDWHGTTVAIRVIEKAKMCKGDLVTIKEEIGLLHKLHHPNLLMLMGYCETQKELYVVSEYMSGGSLKEYLARNRGQLGVFSLIAIAFDVVKGIAYLHASKPPIVHGSISTRSLLVDDKLTTKVSDFWLSRTPRGKRSMSDSHSKAFMNQEWVAPEVTTGMLTPATDVWAFGVVLWELFQSNAKQEAPALAAATLSSSKSSSSSVAMSVQVSPHPEPDASTPKEVVELLYQCWEPQPDQRPTIFTVLRSWPSTFATVGRFELPSDLSQLHTATEDSGASGPDAVVPVAMMSHSEQSTINSLHFEFPSPDVATGSLPTGFCPQTPGSPAFMPNLLVASSGKID